MTALCGFASGFTQLLIARVGVGVGGGGEGQHVTEGWRVVGRVDGAGAQDGCAGTPKITPKRGFAPEFSGMWGQVRSLTISIAQYVEKSYQLD